MVSQESVVRKTQFPRLVIPLAVVLTGLFNLGLNLIVVFIFILAFGVSPIWTWLFLPVLVTVLTVFTTAVAMLLSSLYVRFRDVADHLVGPGDRAVLCDPPSLSARDRA